MEGGVYAACSEHDRCWYRAIVEEIMKDDKVYHTHTIFVRWGVGGGWLIHTPLFRTLTIITFSFPISSSFALSFIIFSRFFQVYVYFVDYGDTAVIEEREDIQPLQEDFLQLPFQGVQGSLVGEFE